MSVKDDEVRIQFVLYLGEDDPIIDYLEILSKRRRGAAWIRACLRNGLPDAAPIELPERAKLTQSSPPAQVPEVELADNLEPSFKDAVKNFLGSFS